MIDLVLQAADRQTIRQFGIANNLLKRDRTVTVDPETGEEAVEFGEWYLRPGVSFSWWNGSGRMMRSTGTFDDEGNRLTAPTFVPGVVALLRIGGAAGQEDALYDTPEDKNDVKEWERSKVARYIRNNG